MKFRHFIACLCLLVGVTSLAAVAYLTWRNVVHGDKMILWLYLILALAGIPLAITWRKDLVATEWPVILSSILAASMLAVTFLLHNGLMDHDNPWHVFVPEEASQHDPPLTLENYFENKPPDKPLWPKIITIPLLIFLGPIFISFIYKGCVSCLRSLSRRSAVSSP